MNPDLKSNPSGVTAAKTLTEQYGTLDALIKDIATKLERPATAADALIHALNNGWHTLQTLQEATEPRLREILPDAVASAVIKLRGDASNQNPLVDPNANTGVYRLTVLERFVGRCKMMVVQNNIAHGLNIEDEFNKAFNSFPELNPTLLGVQKESIPWLEAPFPCPQSSPKSLQMKFMDKGIDYQKFEDALQQAVAIHPTEAAAQQHNKVQAIIGGQATGKTTLAYLSRFSRYVIMIDGGAASSAIGIIASVAQQLREAEQAVTLERGFLYEPDRFQVFRLIHTLIACAFKVLASTVLEFVLGAQQCKVPDISLTKQLFFRGFCNGLNKTFNAIFALRLQEVFSHAEDVAFADKMLATTQHLAHQKGLRPGDILLFVDEFHNTDNNRQQLVDLFLRRDSILHHPAPLDALRDMRPFSYMVSAGLLDIVTSNGFPIPVAFACTDVTFALLPPTDLASPWRDSNIDIFTQLPHVTVTYMIECLRKFGSFASPEEESLEEILVFYVGRPYWFEILLKMLLKVPQLDEVQTATSFIERIRAADVYARRECINFATDRIVAQAKLPKQFVLATGQSTTLVLLLQHIFHAMIMHCGFIELPEKTLWECINLSIIHITTSLPRPLNMEQRPSAQSAQQQLVRRPPSTEPSSAQQLPLAQQPPENTSGTATLPQTNITVRDGPSLHTPYTLLSDHTMAELIGPTPPSAQQPSSKQQPLSTEQPSSAQQPHVQQLPPVQQSQYCCLQELVVEEALYRYFSSDRAAELLQKVQPAAPKDPVLAVVYRSLSAAMGAVGYASGVYHGVFGESAVLRALQIHAKGKVNLPSIPGFESLQGTVWDYYKISFDYCGTAEECGYQSGAQAMSSSSPNKAVFMDHFAGPDVVLSMLKLTEDKILELRHQGIIRCTHKFASCPETAPAALQIKIQNHPASHTSLASLDPATFWAKRKKTSDPDNSFVSKQQRQQWRQWLRSDESHYKFYLRVVYAQAGVSQDFQRALNDYTLRQDYRPVVALNSSFINSVSPEMCSLLQQAAQQTTESKTIKMDTKLRDILKSATQDPEKGAMLLQKLSNMTGKTMAEYLDAAGVGVGTKLVPKMRDRLAGLINGEPSKISSSHATTLAAIQLPPNFFGTEEGTSTPKPGKRKQAVDAISGSDESDESIKKQKKTEKRALPSPTDLTSNKSTQQQKEGRNSSVSTPSAKSTKTTAKSTKTTAKSTKTPGKSNIAIFVHECDMNSYRSERGFFGAEPLGEAQNSNRARND